MTGVKMMNKYEEAYERLRSKEYRYPDHDSVYADIDLLGELVGKETPKMVDGIPNGHIPKHGYCPNCGIFVIQTCKDARCVVYGQMLKWEEEDD